MVTLISTSAPYRYAMGASWLYRPGLFSTRVHVMMFAQVTRAGPYLSCPTSYRCAVKLEILSTFISCQIYDLWSRIRGRSEVFIEAGPRWVVCLGEGGALWGGRGGLCPAFPGGGGAPRIWSPYQLPSWKRQGTLHMHLLRDFDGPRILLSNEFSGPWITLHFFAYFLSLFCPLIFVAVIGKGK
jgi:hypothetical protein